MIREGDGLDVLTCSSLDENGPLLEGLADRHLIWDHEHSWHWGSGLEAFVGKAG